MTHSPLLRALSRILAVALTLVVILPLLAAPGDLDPSWGDGGVLTLVEDPGDPLINPPPPPIYFNDVVVGLDGKVTGVGLRASETWAHRVSATRFLGDGQIDTSYGGAGVAIVENEAEDDLPLLFQAAPMPDGSVLTTGWYHPSPAFGVIFDLHISKITPEGVADPDFGAGGRLLITSLLPYVENFESVSPAWLAVRPDGQFWLAGNFLYRSAPTRSYVLRFHPDGALDRSFAQFGLLNLNDLTGVPTSLAHFTVQPDGKLLFGVSLIDEQRGSSQGVVLRLTPDGAVDPTFGSEGRVEVRPRQLETGQPNRDTRITDIAVQADGRLVLVTYDIGQQTAGGVFVMRLTAKGQPDPSFDQNGVATTALRASYAYRMDSALQANGKIVVGGSISNTPAIARLNADGSADTTWGDAGLVTLALPGEDYTDWDVVEFGHLALQPDGRLLAVPRIRDRGFAFGSFHLVRFEADPAFGTTSLTPVHLATGYPTAAGLSLTFAEPAFVNTGAVEIRRTADSSLFTRIDVADPARVMGNGSHVIHIDPPANFEPNTAYFVLVDPGAFTNAAGHPSSGVRALTEWHFVTGDASVVTPAREWLVNRGFEGKGAKPTRPAQWKGARLLPDDGRTCNVERRGKPPIIHAQAGRCAFRFRHTAVRARAIEQTVTPDDALAGRTLRLSAQVRRKGLTAGAKLRADITYTDATIDALVIAVPKGTGGYQLLTGALPLPKDVTQVRVRALTGSSKGTWLLDAVSLTVDDAAPAALTGGVIGAGDLRGN